MRIKNDENQKKIEGREIQSRDTTSRLSAIQRSPLQNSTNYQQEFPVNCDKAYPNGLALYKAHDTVIAIRGLEPQTNKKVEKSYRCRSAPRSHNSVQRTKDQATQLTTPWEKSEGSNLTPNDLFDNESSKHYNPNTTSNDFCWSKLDQQSESESHLSQNIINTLSDERGHTLPSERSEQSKKFLNMPLASNPYFVTPKFQKYHQLDRRNEEKIECPSRNRSLSRSRPTTCQTSFLLESSYLHTEASRNEIMTCPDVGENKKVNYLNKPLGCSLKTGNLHNYLLGESGVRAAGELRKRIFSKQKQMRIRMGSLNNHTKDEEAQLKAQMGFQVQSQNRQLVIKNNTENSPQSTARSSFQRYTQDKYLPKI